MLNKLKGAGNPYVIAVNVTVLTIAWFHLAILFLKAVTGNRYDLLHIGSILDIQFLAPGVQNDLLSFVILSIPVVAWFFYVVKRVK